MSDEMDPKHPSAIEMRIDASVMIEDEAIEMRSYYSSYYLWSARHHAALAAHIEQDRKAERPIILVSHRAYVITAVLESVAFMEAAINELFADAADDHATVAESIAVPVRNSMRAFWDATRSGEVTLLRKYDAALTLNGHEPFGHGTNPYQGADLLVKLRNWLMHYRPQSLSHRAPHGLEARLKGKFADNELLIGAGNTWFPDHALGAGCAQWACECAVAIVDELTAKIGVALNYQSIEFDQSPTDIT